MVNPNPGAVSNTVFFEVTNSTTFAAVKTPSFLIENEPASVAVGDFNGDGKLDLAVGGSTAISVVSIYLGNGDGTFQPAVSYGPGSGFGSVAIGDFNGDGKLDLAVTDNGNNNVSIFIGNGNGTFWTAVDYGAGTGPSSVAIGDFNGDGNLDLAVTNSRSNNVSILLGNGDGSFRPAVDYRAGAGPNSVAVADFNVDGKLDLAVVNYGSDNVSILLGKGNGTFRSAVDYTVGSIPNSVVVADFNGDGKLDLAVASGNCCGPPPLTGPGIVSFLLGNGNGTFQPAVSFQSAQSALAATVGDFNRDGRLDLAVTDPANAGVAILLQPPVVSGPNATLSTSELNYFRCIRFLGICRCTTEGSVTLSNFGTQTLSISRITTTAPFSQSNNCGTGLAPGRSCTVNVTWDENQGSGERVLSFFDNAPGSPQEVSLLSEKLCNPGLASGMGLARSSACSSP